MTDEADEKRALALAAAKAAGFDGLVATTPATVRWLLCGRGRPVDAASPQAAYAVLLDGERANVLAPNIEAPRVAAEERFEELGFDVVVYPWEVGLEPAVAELGNDRRLVADAELETAIAPLRRTLVPAERDRYAAAGADAAA
ncbi:MAG: hypothetical protein M3327_09120, partial [Actinomycetota bacterium]|nr:hypothetical protein [Actinomycetota bacterium]